MERDYTLDIPTTNGHEQVALLQRSEGEHRFVIWHGITAVNRFWYWDVFWDDGQVTLAGLPGHGAVRPESEAHYLAWTPQHFIEVGIGTARALSNGRPMTLIGHSTGGMVALGVAMQAPELVERLILISPVIWNDLRGLVGLWVWASRWPRLARTLIGANLAAGRRSYWMLRASMRALVSDAQGFYGNPLTDETLRLAMPSYRRTPIDGVAGTARVLRQVDLRPQIKAAPPRVPTLIVHGDRDGIVPLDQSEWLAAQLPEAELVTVAGAGHVSWAERETFVNEHARRWCALHPLREV